MASGLTPKQREALAVVEHYYEATGEPVPASYVARKLDVSRQRVMVYFRTLNDLGWLRTDSSPVVPARRLPSCATLTDSQLCSDGPASDSLAMARRPDPTLPTSGPRTVDLLPLRLRAEFQPNSLNEEDRTIELIFTTGAAVERMDWFTGKRYIETLSMDPSHIRLDRLNAGAPLLDSHYTGSVRDQLGAVVPGTASMVRKEGRARARFSRRDAVEEVWQDVRDGLIRNVSVGYRVYKVEETEGKGNALPIRHAVDWEPFEVSMVSMPADAGAQVRQEEKAEPNRCEIVPAPELATREQPKKEKAMSDENRSEFLVEPNPLPKPTVPPPTPEPDDRALAATAERDRCLGINQAVRSVRLPQSFANKLIADGVSLQDAQGICLKQLDSQPNVPSPDSRGEGIGVGDDPLVHVRSGIEGALLHRVNPDRFKLDDKSRPYAGMGVLDIGKVFLNARGVRTTSLDRSRLVDALLSRTGLHTTTDFPSLFEDAANKNLRAAYEAAPQTWLPLSKLVTLSDFKPSRQLQVGDAPALLEILEHGEYTFGTIGEAKETIQLKTYGRMFGITRQALINDDLNAFGEVPAAFGRKARDIESDLAWAQITANGLMGDGVALFSVATHANLTTGPGTVISIASLGIGRAAMRNQKGIDAATPLNLTPRFLIVPAALETIADQFVTQITPALSGSVNPFTAGGRTPLTTIVEPRLDVNSAVSWYLATDVTSAPLLYHGVLAGQEGPLVTQMEGFDVDGMKFRCRIDVAFKAADWRAGYKNVGV